MFFFFEECFYYLCTTLSAVTVWEIVVCLCPPLLNCSAVSVPVQRQGIARRGGVEDVYLGVTSHLVHVEDDLVEVLEVVVRRLEVEVSSHREHDVPAAGREELGLLPRTGNELRQLR